MRIVNLLVGGQEGAECYVTALPGDGGGVTANVNMWRNQMLLPPLNAQEIIELPKKKLLKQDSVFVDFNGTFTGMKGEVQNADYKLVGMIMEHHGSTIFVKMVDGRFI